MHRLGSTHQCCAAQRGKSALRYFLSVPQAISDTTAMYECRPHALVSRSSSGVIELKVSDNEVHQWLPCCEDTCASELLSGLDSDSEEEGEDGSECGKRAEIDTAAVCRLHSTSSVRWT